MMQSPFTFLRGSAIVMTADLATTPYTGIPVQACGDCHLLNFGGFATPERNLVFDINDFDETLIAPWEWDLKRLATSIYVAGQALQLPDLACVVATRACARAYRLALAQYSQMRTLDVWYARLDADWLIEHAPDTDTRKHWIDMAKRAFQQNMSRKAQKITEKINGKWQFIEDYPLLFHPPNRSDYFSEVATLFEDYRDSLQWDRQFLLDRYQLVDVALKVVGVGSVGTHCGVALLLDANGDPLLLQYKQAQPSVLESHLEPSTHEHAGQRIVTGQRLIQAASDIFLGWTSNTDGQDFYFRQLKDWKTSVKLKGMSACSLEDYSEICGSALARTHSRTGDAAMISGYLGKTDTFDQLITDFAIAYAHQVELDFQRLIEAVKSGRITAKER